MEFEEIMEMIWVSLSFSKKYTGQNTVGKICLGMKETDKIISKFVNFAP